MWFVKMIIVNYYVFKEKKRSWCIKMIGEEGSWINQQLDFYNNNKSNLTCYHKQLG